MILVRFFDFIGKKTGQAFGIIFKIIIPFIATFIPIDQVSSFVIGSNAKIGSIVLWTIFMALLIFAPKVASVSEFFIIGFALVFTIGSNSIDHWWGWCVMLFAGVFLFFKILFLINILIKKADGTYENIIPEEEPEKYMPENME